MNNEVYNKMNCLKCKTENIKKDGSKKLIALKAARLLIIELDLSDKIRKEKLESHKKTEKVSGKKSSKVEAKK